MPSDHASTPPPPAGHEPEIVFLGKVVHVGMLVFRGATVLAALLGIAYGISQMLGFGPSAVDGGVKTAPSTAPHFVWFCIGIPPLVSIRWLFGRGRWLMLALGIALWVGPNFLESDSDYGYIIRFFASLVALSVLFVWRTVFDLCLRAKSGNNPA